MNKKAAIVTAGGLVSSFVAGMAAVTFNWGLGTPATSATSASAAAPTQTKPIIKHRTITIHRRDPAATPSPRTVVLPRSPSTSASVATTSGSHAAGGEDDGEREGGDD